MDYCKNCKRWTCGAQGTSHEMPIPCGNYIPPTNYDLVKKMSVEELAELFKSPLFFNKPWCCLHEEPCRHLDKKEFMCAECLLDWLRQEAKT